ncbi:MAG: hypothetical protein ACRDFX_04935 [Chloroflexota bacterium]
MNVVDDAPEVGFCARHPSRETRLRCSKCETFICTGCIVQTPVGARCRNCAQLRRLPQHDLGLKLLARSGLAGLAVSLAGWYLLAYAVFLRYLLSVLLGAAIGAAMSRLARRRSSLVLEIAAVIAVVAGLLAADILHFGSIWESGGFGQSALVGLIIPGVLASFIAVVKLR